MPKTIAKFLESLKAEWKWVTVAAIVVFSAGMAWAEMKAKEGQLHALKVRVERVEGMWETIIRIDENVKSMKESIAELRAKP